MLRELRKLASLLGRREVYRFVGLLGLMFVASLLEIVGISAVPAFIATLAVPEKVMDYAFLRPILEWLSIDTGRDLVLWGSLALVLVFLLKTAFISFVYWVQVRMAESYQVRLADRLFACYMKAPYAFHLTRNTAELLRNVNNETTLVVTGIIYPLMAAIMSTMMTLLIVGLLVITTPLYAVAGIGVVALGSWAITRASKTRLHKSGVAAQRERRASVQAINQGLGGVLEARLLGVENYFISVYQRSNARFRRARRTSQLIAKTTSPMLEFTAVAGMLLVVVAISLRSSDIKNLIPAVALFGAAIIRLKGSTNAGMTGFTNLRYNIVAIDPIYRDIKLLEEPKRKARKEEGERSRKKLRLSERISVDAVTYAYSDSPTPVLRDVSLTIERGSSVAFVGSTGSGKTTLINVLLGLLEPQEGRILVDGADIRMDLPKWHANVGYIPQTIYLLDDTIRRNIAFGIADADIDDERLLSAIQAAQLEEFVDGLEHGLEAVIGERGVRISGGQRQRIGLARALYHDPEVLIMDEATSALDNRTEHLVMQALDRLRSERTIIMIAHRLSTVRNCDRIYFMKDGQIEASGTYDELNYAHEDFRVMAEVA
ncbi:MAG TPA: ABC transporter ATP-binding protein [Rhodothermales bacterium]|nr:ABC transporter ATP-binding protein [Rhodothermales bacterium]